MALLNLNKKRKLKKKINGQEFEIVPYVSMAQKRVILDAIVAGTDSRMDENKSDFSFLVTTAYMTMDVLLVNMLTDIDNGADDYEKMVSSGLIEIIHNSITNFDDIRASVDATLYLCYICKSVPSYGNIQQDIARLRDFMNGMTDEQKKNLETIAKITTSQNILSNITKNKNGGSKK